MTYSSALIRLRFRRRVHRFACCFLTTSLSLQRRQDVVTLTSDSDVGLLLADASLLYLGTLHGVAVEAGDLVADAAIAEPLVALSLRDLFGLLGDDEYGLAGYASQMLHWRRTSRFCPVCGHETIEREGDWGRLCPSCAHISYPHVTPATLILIHDGADRILLGHKPGWGDRYSILAGFVEPGESLEECVLRETMEEVGVVIDDLEYAGSQPWPYPHQLMIGFKARWISGDVRFDGVELDDARIGSRRNLCRASLRR